jgi:glycine/D-amino acid oxidase-like deaminating enzyme
MANGRYIVVGGGIAGLTAAIELAHRGRRVTVFEQSQKLGGRGGTETRQGFLLNRGPHALYRHGHAYRTWTEWEIPFSGKSPKVKRDAYVVLGSQLHPFPADLVRLFATSAFRGAEKFAAARAFWQVMGKLPEPALTVDQWLEEKLGRASDANRPRLLVEALIRLSTYSNQFNMMGARAALAQVQFAINNGVLYLDGGWETVVTGLAAHAASLGVRVETGAAVEHVESGCVRLAGREIACDGVVLAVTPGAVESLTGVRMASLTPVRAACLDLAMTSLPPKAAVFALGLDAPFYFSRHSAVASLAPEGASLVQVAKYLVQGEHAQREELERFTDLAMPGWRDHTAFTRFLPDIAVTHAVVTPATSSGRALDSPEGRPGVDALGIADIALAGDWVGDAGMLVDAAVASALRAAASLLDERATGRKAAAA